MQLALYNYYRSSASYRVRIALHLKGLSFDYKPVSLIQGDHFSETYRKLNPLSQVPSLVHGDTVISQSMAIIDYLEHLKPEPALFPKDAKDRAKVIQLCEVINSGIQPLQNLSVTKELEANYDFVEQDSGRWRRYWIERGLTSFEAMLATTAGKYCLGDIITAADCFLVPQIFSAERFGAKVERFKKTMEVYNRLLAVPEVAAAHPAKQPDSK